MGSPCFNEHHGCGYTDSQEKMKPTNPFFKGRNFMKRLYSIVKSRKPEGFVELHCGSYWLSPITGWADNVWDGEVIMGDKKLTPDKRRGMYLMEYFPIDSFRAQYMGRAWGVSTEFLDYYVPYPFERQFAVTLLHNVPVRPHNNKDNIDFSSKIWNMMDKFDRKNAQWIPYWQSGKYVKVSSEDIYVSLYKHPKNGVLTIISNLGKKEENINLEFSLSELGITNQSTAIDALSNKAIPLQEGKITLSINSIDWKPVWIKPSGKNQK